MALFTAFSIQYGLPNGLLKSLCFVESGHHISKVHYDDGGSDSYGVCQIKYETAYHLGFRGTRKQLMEPKYNVKYAAKYLAHQLRRYNGSVKKAVIAYNQGHAGHLTTTAYQTKVFLVWNEQ